MKKVITIKEPFASLIIEGYKNYEFRSWKTHYRGKLLIHTSKSENKNDIKLYKNLNLDLKYSAIIGEVEIVNCYLIDKELIKKIKKENPYLKNIPTKGYAWEFRNNKKLKSDKIIKGKLSLWNIDEKELFL